jgi:hypothetical protein
MYNHDGQKIESYIAPSITFEAQANNTLTLGYYRQFEEYAGYNFDKDWFYIQFINQSFSWLFFDVRTFLGDAIYYDAIYYGIAPFLGTYRYIDFDMELRPLKNWSVLFSVKNYLFNGSANGDDYRTNQDIYRMRTTYQFTRALGLRFIVEYNNLLNDLDLNALFSYQPFPGTVFFLGYNDHFQDYSVYHTSYEKNKYIRDYRGFFLKLSYLFRI